MNFLSKVSLITMGFLTSSLALATVENSTNSTTCYIMKNNKVSKQAPCSFEQDEGPDFLYQTFKAKGLGQFKIDVESGGTKLNGKPAKSQYRALKTYKLMSVDDSFKASHLSCQKTSSIEFCYADQPH